MPKKKKPGRPEYPTKLDDALLKRIRSQLRMSRDIGLICDLLQISRSTLNRWFEEGEKIRAKYDESDGKVKLTEGERRLLDFHAGVTQAKALGKVRLINAGEKSGKNSHFYWDHRYDKTYPEDIQPIKIAANVSGAISVSQDPELARVVGDYLAMRKQKQIEEAEK